MHNISPWGPFFFFFLFFILREYLNKCKREYIPRHTFKDPNDEDDQATYRGTKVKRKPRKTNEKRRSKVSELAFEAETQPEIFGSQEGDSPDTDT